MAGEASEIQTIPNGTTDQTITTAQPVTVTPVTSQPVETTVAGPATIEAAAVKAAESNPVWLLGAISVVGAVLLAFCLWFVAYNTLRWVDGNNARAGSILGGIAEPLTVLGAALVAGMVMWFQQPPKRGAK